MQPDTEHALLFDIAPASPASEPDAPPKKSDGVRRTERQYQAILDGRHPLTGWPVHAEAADVARELPTPTQFAYGERHRKPEDPAPGRRCGNCKHLRSANAGTASDYPKCWYGWDGVPSHAPPRYTRGPASDVRAWWPGCREHEHQTQNETTTPGA